jgi:hypothetical protein
MPLTDGELSSVGDERLSSDQAKTKFTKRICLERLKDLFLGARVGGSIWVPYEPTWSPQIQSYRDDNFRIAELKCKAKHDWLTRREGMNVTENPKLEGESRVIRA